MLLCLHQWETHGHPTLARPDPPPGNSLLLFFRIDDFDEALSRARALAVVPEEKPHRNPNTATMESPMYLSTVPPRIMIASVIGVR